MISSIQNFRTKQILLSLKQGSFTCLKNIFEIFSIIRNLFNNNVLHFEDYQKKRELSKSTPILNLPSSQ